MSRRRRRAKPTMEPPDSGVTVRMYNPGFGDCLLLAFRAEDGPCYMLIDCGVHHQYPDGDERLQMIASDIAEATSNRLHVVVATHEHTDHLYGFKYGRAAFDGIKIDELWLAWTEDPDDAVAKELKSTYGLRIKALIAAAERLGQANAPLANALQNILQFEFPDSLAAATGGKAAQLDYLRKRSKKKLRRSLDYRQPGEAPLTLPGVRGTKVYILGPPKDVAWIRKLEKKSELYPKLTVMNEMTAFEAAALAAAGADSIEDVDRQLFRRSRPFDETLEITKDDAYKHPEFSKFFQRNYGFSNQRGQGPEWRRIETDWLEAAEQLALDLNAKTNNTSLVLAIELTDAQPSKVLLFTADAQVGNWLSWHELCWPGEGQDNETVTAEYLLQRTVLLKTGHHGSRNATLSWKGLEMMESADLVAMIPVDQEWANNVMRWEHPAEKLLEKLKEKTRGRIIRTDDIPSGDRPPEKPSNATESEWKTFQEQLDWDRSSNKLWIQYTVTE
jgi:beta-lactamase superfamily II metal-dependent hydrolase